MLPIRALARSQFDLKDTRSYVGFQAIVNSQPREVNGFRDNELCYELLHALYLAELHL